MNRQQRRAAAAYKRKWTSGEWRQGTMIYTQTIGVLHPHGYFYYWFECPANFSPEDGIPPDTIMHGPSRRRPKPARTSDSSCSARNARSPKVVNGTRLGKNCNDRERTRSPRPPCRPSRWPARPQVPLARQAPLITLAASC